MYMVEVRGKRYYVEVGDDSADIMKIEDAISDMDDDLPDFDDDDVNEEQSTVVADMPCAVVRVMTEVGARVKKDTPLLCCETMKMEREVLAPCNGMVSNIYVRVGMHAEKGQKLLDIDPE